MGSNSIHFTWTLSSAAGSAIPNEMLFISGQERPSGSEKRLSIVTKHQPQLGKEEKHMSEREEPGHYEVGYGKPRRTSQFKKGESGNPSGRPKKPTDSDSEWRRELASKMTVIEKGKRNTITK